MIKVERVEEGLKWDDVLRISFKYDSEIVERIKSLPRRCYIPNLKLWEVPYIDLNLVNRLFKDFPFEVDKVLDEDIKEGVEKGRERLEGIVPIISFNFKTNPYPHQIEAFNIGLSKDNILIADEMGLGKTKESIDIAVARKLDDVKRCLIVCGVNSVKYNWEKEIQIHSDDMSMVFDAKSLSKREKQIDSWIDNQNYFGIINIESLRSKKILDKLKMYIDNGEIGLVIIDEIHKAKNGQSQQGKALRELDSKYKIGLTGTPIMNKAEELWNIFNWLGEERGNFYKFRNRYCILGGFGGYQVVAYKNLDELHERLNRVMIRRKKEEVIDLPPKIYKTEYIELGEKQKELYNQIKQGLIEELGEIILNPSPLSSLIRLRQVTAGVLGEEEDKINRLKELLVDIEEVGGKAIIFTNWKTVSKKIYGYLKDIYNIGYIDGDIKVEDRQKEVDRFQKNVSSHIIGTIGALGTGLTLNKATHVIFMDKAWTPADNEQAEDRAHRIGTTGTVNVITLVAKDTIDERIEEILKDKSDIFNKVVEGKLNKVDNKELIMHLLK